jgi:lysozyme
VINAGLHQQREQNCPPCSEKKIPMKRFAKLRRLVVLMLPLTAAAACGGKVVQQADYDPHSGVMRAHSLPVQGIDVAKYQGRVDWKQIRKSGVQFAYLKATEGGDRVDASFHENWRNAAAAGVPRGAYHFMYWCRPAAEQAAWFARVVPPDRSQLPPVLDLEWNSASPTCPRRVPRRQALEEISVMLSMMEQHTGKRPVIYTDITFHRDVLEGELRGHDFWLRSVAAEPSARFNNRPWTFWQYTATGHVPGITGAVDRNAFHGSAREWERWVQSR